MRRTNTFDFFTFRPRWRSYSWTPRRTSALWFKWYDFVPLVLFLMLAPLSTPEWVVAIMAAWYFAGFPIMLWFRLRRRARYVCAKVGHMPWRPTPDEDHWECEFCGTDLEPDEAIFEGVESARRPRGQAFYSDRR